MLKVKKITPVFNHILTTADRYEQTALKDGLIEEGKGEDQMKEYQKIIAVGPNCSTQFKEGQLVVINPKEYARPVHSMNSNSVLSQDEDSIQMVVNWPIIEVDGKQYLYIYDRDIELVITDFEEVDY